MPAQAIYEAVVNSLEMIAPEAYVFAGVPKRLNVAPVLVYVFHDGSSDYTKTVGAVIQRTHVFQIRAVISSQADEREAEVILLQLHDRICNGFYTNRTLSGAAVSSMPAQRDSQLGGLPPYVIDNDVEYRQRGWTLQAVEDVQITFA